ncbi:hypothetical protein PPERSA_07461 [Pseudocohnilembus persalinus]|uniref:Uncharacterized protein n=1 Tax=Pseudocohnilembus persalinus TaxID=266149 RepID=A0A0V0QAK7_PSEPJ|nr:hypothetical protein PPERSA_07461 [Pseudocohnilembus persalinus]|eukprot:KRW99218.1 hypothetical protein PPERSA_07461 [Pseudocohnilembus persalinus]
MQKISYRKEIENTLKEFQEYLKLKGDLGELIINSLKKMEGAKLGLEFGNTHFLHFCFFIQKFLKQTNNPKQVFEVVVGLRRAGITHQKVWKSVFEYIKQNENKIPINLHLEIVYYLLDFKIDNETRKYYEDKDELIIDQVNIMLTQDNYIPFIYGLQIMIYLEKEIPFENAKGYLEYLVKNKSVYFQYLDAYHFADLAYLTYSILNQLNISGWDEYELERMKQKKGDQYNLFLKQCLENYINLDLVQYDQMLSQYQFFDEKQNQIGIFDRITWSSISKIMQILTDPSFMDESQFRRLEDQIFRKSETDVIDLQNAAILIECYSELPQNDLNCIMRIFQMLDFRLKAEKDKAKDSFEANSVIRLLRALHQFHETSVENQILINTVKYFGGVIKYKDLEMNQDQAFELKLIYEESPFTQNDPKIVEALNQKLQEFAQ